MTNNSLMAQLKSNLTTILFKRKVAPLDTHIFSLFKPKQVYYCCAIAFQLAAREGQSPQDWAKKIYDDYQVKSNPDFSLIIRSDGRLDFIPYPQTLNKWLVEFSQNWQQICSKQNQIIDYDRYKSFNPFFCQYVYGRCCSLQRLVIQEQASWQNEQIPWLFFLENHHLTKIQEWELLQKIVFICDRLTAASDQDILKFNMALAESFLAFERHCQILGEVSKKIPQLAQVRLGLVNCTAMIFQYLLTDYLQLKPLV